MDVTRFSIQNNRMTLVALAVICVAGYQAFLTLPQAEDPGFTIRTAVVITYFPGANPQRVEDLVTDKLEKAIQELPELDAVRSQSTTGVSVVTVDIKEEYRDMRPIWDNLRRKVEKAERELPEGVRGPFVNDEFGDTFGSIIAVTGDGYSYADLKDVAFDVRDMLLQLEDAGRIELHGVQEERVFIEFSGARLAELGLSVGQLQQQLEAQNILIPGGSVSTGVERIELEPTGSFESIADLASTVIRSNGEGSLIHLEDIATISRGYSDPPESLMRANGFPALGIAVSTKSTGNIVRHGEQILALIDRLRNEYPAGLELSVVAFQPEVVERKVDEFVTNVLQAIGIVLLAMLVMLGPRTGLVVASLIPAAMLMSLAVMQQLDIGLNQMSLAALIIALGMLVDNAIVMSESIMVEMAAGKAAIDAAVDSARELRVPLLTSSLTTSAAFLPIYLAESTVGEYTNQLFTVVTIALLSSWALALTVIPLLCVLFLKVKPTDDDSTDGWLYRSYRNALITSLRFRWIAIGAVVGIFYVAMQGFAYIPNIFFPPSDKPMFTVEIEAPTGTAIERTEQIVEAVEGFIENDLAVSPDREEGIASWSTYVGRGAPRFTLSYGPEQSRPEYAYMIVNTTSPEVVPEVRQRLDAFLGESFPGIRTVIQALQNGPVVRHPIEVRLMGDDVDRLFTIVEELKTHLRETPGLLSIGDDWGNRTKKIVVDVDNARARRAGLSNQDVALSLMSNLSGFEVTDYREGDEVIPVTMRSKNDDRRQIATLETLNVYSQSTGRSVPLQAVADLEVVWQPAKIFRRNRLKAVTVFANLAPGVTATESMRTITPWIEERSSSWPLGFRHEFGGELEASGDGNQSIGEKLPIAGLAIILLLVGQFNSIRRPLIILLTIPLGLIGVVIGLLLTGSYMGFMTFLGIISLSGIVINNAIVLLDRIQIEIERNGLPENRAVIEAAQRRLRPILLTTVTTVGGLIPLWLGGGVMFEPMAIAILFGLIFATALTLGVVPILYSIFFRLDYKGFRWNPS
jgi:multidrug efflux pump